MIHVTLTCLTESSQLQEAQQAPLCTPDFCEDPPHYPGTRITQLLRDYKPLPGQFDTASPGPRTSI